MSSMSRVTVEAVGLVVFTKNCPRVSGSTRITVLHSCACPRLSCKTITKNKIFSEAHSNRVPWEGLLQSSSNMLSVQ